MIDYTEVEWRARYEELKKVNKKLLVDLEQANKSIADLQFELRQERGYFR